MKLFWMAPSQTADWFTASHSAGTDLSVEYWVYEIKYWVVGEILGSLCHVGDLIVEKNGPI